MSWVYYIIAKINYVEVGYLAKICAMSGIGA